MEQDIDARIAEYLGEDWQQEVIAFAGKALVALLIIIIGFWLAGKLAKMLNKRMRKRGLDDTTANFLSSLLSVGFKILVIMAAADQVGVAVTGFIAILGAMAFAVGLALQGTLGHFASGVLLLIFRPYKVGDLVTIGGGMTGVVLEIAIFNTVLSTPDNRRIIIPNGQVTNNPITNINGQGTLGVDLTFGIGYTDDIDKAREIILRVAAACPTVIDVPATGVVVKELADSSVNLATRPFCNSGDSLATRFYMIENVKKAFDAEGISIPFPQVDVHMQSE